MDAFELLEQDHQKVSDIFEQLEPTSEGDVGQRKELFAQLKSELDVHSNIEEKILYPTLKEFEETREMTFESVEEHAVVKALLAELEEMSPDREEWTAKLKVLQENVEHHVDEEENELFEDAREVLSQDQIDELGRRLEAEKQTQKSAAAGR